MNYIIPVRASRAMATVATSFSRWSAPGALTHVSIKVQILTFFNTVDKCIEGEELYQYSSGRWLINEKQQLAQRYVKFDIQKLCERAASALGGSPTTCTEITKIEGSFNKALLLRMEDGREVVAKLPCPNAGPANQTTASEAATIEFSKGFNELDDALDQSLLTGPQSDQFDHELQSQFQGS